MEKKLKRKPRQSDGRGAVYGGKDLRKMYLLSLEWKRLDSIITNDSGDDGTDELRQFG